MEQRSKKVFRYVLNIIFILVFSATALSGLLMSTLLGLSAVPLLAAQWDIYFCLRYFFLESAPRTGFRTFSNAFFLTLSATVNLVYYLQISVFLRSRALLIPHMPLFFLLVAECAAYIILRLIYWITVDIIDTRREKKLRISKE